MTAMTAKEALEIYRFVKVFHDKDATNIKQLDLPYTSVRNISNLNDLNLDLILILL